MGGREREGDGGLLQGSETKDQLTPCWVEREETPEDE